MKTIVKEIQAFNTNRDPDKRALKYAVMQQNPFRFYRGTCHLFYKHLYTNNILPISPLVWACGDLHLENFGSFKGKDRLVYFDGNDFDEAMLTPATWELVRLLCSVVVAYNTEIIIKKDTNVLVKAVLNGYMQQLQEGKAMTVEKDTAAGIIKTLLYSVELRTETKLLKQHTTNKSNATRFKIDNKKAFTLKAEIKRKVIKGIKAWLTKKDDGFTYIVHDAIYRLAGTGSIGIQRYAVLVENTTTQKKIILDVKQALPSSLVGFNDIKQPVWQNEAERILQIQHRMQHICPNWLSTLTIDTNHFIVKEIQPLADAIDFMTKGNSMQKRAATMKTLGKLTAAMQLRSSGRQGSDIADELINFGKDESWHQSLIDYAFSYANQVQIDYKLFCKALSKGNIY